MYFKRNSVDLLILFTRHPIPGRTKTRLIPVMGPIGAAELHRRLTERTLRTISSASKSYGCDMEIYFDGTSTRNISKWLGGSFSYKIQRGEDLGERLVSAFSDAFKKGYERVVLIGTDIPALNERHIIKAFNLLRKDDLVIGPSTDGGYWLVGMRGYSNIFRIKNWGSGGVLDHTISLVKAKGLSYRFLEYLTDIDTPDDLNTCKIDLDWQKPYLSVVIPTLNEAGNIESAINRASAPEVEVIVVDGGSCDGTEIVAKKAGAIVINASRGRALQLNMGAKRAKGKVLLFLHADTLLPQGFPYLIFSSLLNRNVIAGVFRFRTDVNNLFMKMIEFSVNLRSRYISLPYGDQAIFIRKPVFEKVSGFPGVPIAEDLLFIRDISKKGKIVISSANVITSARRWRDKGLFRTFIIHQIIMFGILAGISPEKFIRLRR